MRVPRRQRRAGAPGSFIPEAAQRRFHKKIGQRFYRWTGSEYDSSAFAARSRKSADFVASPAIAAKRDRAAVMRTSERTDTADSTIFGFAFESCATMTASRSGVRTEPS